MLERDGAGSAVPLPPWKWADFGGDGVAVWEFGPLLLDWFVAARFRFFHRFVAGDSSCFNFPANSPTSGRRWYLDACENLDRVTVSPTD